MKIRFGFLVSLIILNVLFAESSLAEPPYRKTLRRCTTKLTDGMMAFSQKDYDKAIYEYEKFLVLHDSIRISFGPILESNLPMARANLAESYCFAGQTKKGFYLIHDANEFHPGNSLIDSLTLVISENYLLECTNLVEKSGSLEAHLELGNAYAVTGCFASAKGQARLIVEKYPESSEGHFLLGKTILLLSYLTFEELGKEMAIEQNHEAMKCFIRAWDMGFRSPALFFNLASTYTTAENYPGAIDCFFEGIEIYPTDDRLYAGLSSVYAKVASIDEEKSEEYQKLSKKYYRIARQIRPEREVIREKMIIGH